MTKQDWSPLSGDPGCTETLEEWAADMLAQFAKMSQSQCNQTVREMTEDERDAFRKAVATSAWTRALR